MKSALSLVAFSLCALPFPAAGDTIELPKNNAVVSAAVPDYWDAKELGDGILAESPGRVGMISFRLLDADNTLESIIADTMHKLSADDDVIVDAITQQNASLEERRGKSNQVSWTGSSREWGPTMIGLITTDVGHDQKLVITYWLSKKDSERSLKSLGKVIASVRSVR